MLSSAHDVAVAQHEQHTAAVIPGTRLRELKKYQHRWEGAAEGTALAELLLATGGSWGSARLLPLRVWSLTSSPIVPVDDIPPMST